MRLLAIVNPAAGHGRCGRLAGRALDRLRDAGATIETVETGRPGHATALAARAYTVGWRHFLAVGGDGTAFEVVNGLAARPERCTLGLLPLGTGNSFLRDFSCRPLAHACERIVAGATRPCDLLRLEHADGVLHSINLVGFGFPADVAEVTNRRFKRLGAAGYVLGVLACLVRLERHAFPVRIDGGDVEAGRGLMLIVANSRHTGGRMKIAPDADPGDGLAEVVRLGPIGRLTLLRRLFRLIDGSYVAVMRQAQRRPARELEFADDVEREVMIDGEVARLRCRRLSVVPHALDVFA